MSISHARPRDDAVGGASTAENSMPSGPPTASPWPVGAKWDAMELARAMNVARFNIGEHAAEQVVVTGMTTIQRALQDAEPGMRYESWDDVVDELAAEWGSDSEQRVQDIREALF